MDEKTIRTETIYRGRVLTLETVDVELSDGTLSNREIVRHQGAVVVLARRPDGRYVFVRQFRKPVEQVVLEAVAGLLEPGEAPEKCARRELEEETGCHATSIHSLGAFYATPGYTDELLHAFFIEAEPDRGEVNLDHDERLEVVLLERDAVNELIRKGQIVDGKTLAAWLLYEKRVEASNA